MYKTEKEISAGGVLFRPDQQHFQVILINRKNGTVWCLPKGKIEKDETREETALREVEEETAHQGEIVSYLNDVRYWYIDKERNLRLNKTVYFFLIKDNGGDSKNHDPEAEKVEWFEIEEAIKIATYPGERQTLEKARELLLKANT